MGAGNGRKERVWDGEYADKEFIATPSPRTEEEIRRARIGLATLALGTPSPAEWLGDVLPAMGLDDAGREEARRFREACYPHAGTRRGYILHLSTYTRMCDLCQPVQDAERARPRRHEGELA